MTEVINVPVIGVSITANVDGDRQVVFQTAIDPAQTDTEVNALLDRLMGFASRQKLIHDIVGMRKDLKQMSLDIDRFTIQEADTKLRAKVANAELDVQILEWQRQKKAIFDSGYAKHVGDTNRRGEYRPRGQDAIQIERIEAAILDAQQCKAKNDEGLAAEIENHQTNIERRKTRIEELTAEIAAAEAKVAG
jgi:hypothetical protein